MVGYYSDLRKRVECVKTKEKKNIWNYIKMMRFWFNPSSTDIKMVLWIKLVYIVHKINSNTLFQPAEIVLIITGFVSLVKKNSSILKYWKDRFKTQKVSCMLSSNVLKLTWAVFWLVFFLLFIYFCIHFPCDHCLKEGTASSTLFAYSMANFRTLSLIKAY